MKKIIFIIMFINCVSQLNSQIYEFDSYETKPALTPPQVMQYPGNDYKWRMTLENEFAASALWNMVAPTNKNPNINLDTNFCLRFYAKFSKNSNGDAGADGIAFILKNPTSNYWVGNNGAGIGYVTIQHSLAIEFDTYWNELPTDTFSMDQIQYVYTEIARTKIGNEQQILPGLEDNVENNRCFFN